MRQRADRRVSILAVVTLVLGTVIALPLQPTQAAALSRTVSTHTSGAGAFSLSLHASVSSAATGIPITYTAQSTDPAPLAYQFQITYKNNPALIVRDFSPKASFVAPGALTEGPYTVTVLAKEILSSSVPSGLGYGQGSTTQASTNVTITNPVRTSNSVALTSNPLVAVYRAPACPVGDVAAAVFRRAGTSTWTATNSVVCQLGAMSTFYVAGLAPSTAYNVAHVVARGAQILSLSPVLTVTTGALPSSLVLPTFTVGLTPTAQSYITDSLINYQITTGDNVTTGTNIANPIATTLQGQVVWYGAHPDFATTWSMRYTPGVEYLAGNDLTQPSTGGLNVLQATDLTGIAQQETNIGAINDQLVTNFPGNHLIYGFHHDVLPLPGGRVALLAFTTDTITTTPILADEVIVVDKNWQVSWVWDAFRHLDPTHGPVLGETCGHALQVLCPVPGGAASIDWLHANALEYSAKDQNLLVSIRHLDQVIKINYANGSGDGHVIWRLGLGGDFTLANPSGSYPWFSHQHDSNLLDPTTLTLYDNGNTRCATAAPGTCDSRGQEYQLNEQTMVVTQTLNVDLGNYSAAVGVAQRLANGNFNFDSGFLTTKVNGVTQSLGEPIEVTRNGSQVYIGQEIGSVAYRAWRLPTLYSSINQACPTCLPGQ